ncbi:F0F1 ATP synthase subunit delta [Cryobacterium sp. BB736]|uniref:F0F1 ATP synthase subunit delta n=1 Tax=Cryobacterium sp. BB736 TaxID=2746963 RepID=UPI001873559D|nr:F0F1 ATP synthase subunit delta [Cryobacterium sp. BB736]
MGSATTQALEAARSALSAAQGPVPMSTGAELLSAGRLIGGSKQLASAIADPSASAEQKRVLADRIFGALEEQPRGLLDVLVANRWSSGVDLLAGIEEIGIRAVARSADAGTDIVGELFAFGAAVTSDAELELAVVSKLGDADAKLALVDALLAGKASEQTLVIVRHLVQQPRGRRIGALLRDAAEIVASEAGSRIATVTAAQPLASEQLQRLRAGLAARYGQLTINLVVDPTIIGGLRVQVGNDVIDDTVASKLGELRLQLAG